MLSFPFEHKDAFCMPSVQQEDLKSRNETEQTQVSV